MRILRRLTLLGTFGAAGIGLALCVGLSSDLPSADSATEPSASASTTEAPSLNEPLDTAQTPPAADRFAGFAPAGPIVAPSYPAVANQVAPTQIDPKLVQEGVDILRRQLLGEKGTGQAAVPAAAVPSVSPTPSAAESLPAPAASAGQSSAPTTNEITQADGQVGNGHLKINVQNTDIREVLELLGRQGDMNILPSPNVTGKVSATLNDVDISSALDAILKSSGYTSKREGKFIYIGTPEDFTSMEQLLDRVGTRVYRPNYVTAMDLQTLIQPMLTDKIGMASVTAAAESGIGADDTQAGGDSFAGGEAVLVRDYEAILTEIDQIVTEIDVRPMQVHIEAMILSVKLEDSDKFGVDFELLRNNPNIKFGIGNPPSTLADFKFDKGSLKVGFLDSSLGAFLEALETISDINVMATPRLMAINKHRAEIQIGKQDGYINTTITETSSAQNVEFLDTGVILRLRPFISSDGLIRMEVHPEVSDGSVEEKGEFTLPEKTITQVTTNIMIRDGCTAIIGGLMRDQLTNTTSQVPLFGNLPVVGPLFRTRTEKIIREEIIVLITPHIVYEPDLCNEGEKAAAEFHRRQAVYTDNMSFVGKRAIGKRYFRRAQQAWEAGNRRKALRFAEMAVFFDPMNRAAIDLRSDIWQGNSFGDHTLSGQQFGVYATPDPLEGQAIAPWLLDQLEQEAPPPMVPLHPYDPGQPGRHRDIDRPRRLQ